MPSSANTVKATEVSLPQREGRNPLVLVTLQLHSAWSVKVAVQRLRDGLVMRMPTAADTTPGFVVAPPLLDQMARTALEAVTKTPEAMVRLLDGPGSYASGRNTHRPLPTPLSISIVA